MARFGIVILLVAQPAFASSHDDCAQSGACCFPRSEPYVMRASARPREAKLAAITVSEGGLARWTVKRMLAERTAALGACASAALRVHLVISPAGGVQQTGASGCVAEALRAIRFPASNAVTEVELRLTW